MKDALLTLFLCLLFTELFEIGGAIILGVRKKHDILTVFLVNSLTNPVAVLTNMAFSSFTSIPKIPFIAVIEITVFIAEALIYRSLLDYKRISPFLLSLILNIMSFVMGSLAVSLIC